MLKWLRRKVNEKEEPVRCGFILIQSECYKNRVEAGVIDHTDALTLAY